MSDLLRQWNLCASIPVHSFNSISPIVRRAEVAGANWIEYRLDYFVNIASISIQELSSILTLTSLSTIFCIGTQESPIPAVKKNRSRKKLLLNCIQAHPTLVDLDISLPINDLIELSHQAGQQNVGIVYSMHNIEQTPPISDIINQLNEIEHEILPLIPALPRVILKLVYYAHQIKDNDIVMPVYHYAQGKPYELILFCMGSFGSISRIYSLHAGAPFAYVAIDAPTAPGQLSIEEFKKKMALL